MNILDNEASVDSAFLHPGGLRTSSHLAGFLRVKPGHTLLEIGCGTGATAVLLAKTPGLRVVGLDRSPQMLESARKRVRKCGVSDAVDLVQADARLSLPFSDNRFDGIYAESVLVFLETDIIRECYRLLRSGQFVVFTERIWKSEVDGNRVDRINERSRSLFGIPAATSRPFDRTDWCSHLENAGFDMISTIPVRNLVGDSRGLEARERFRRFLRHCAHPRTLLRSLLYRKRAWLSRDFDRSLESFLFIARKPA